MTLLRKFHSPARDKQVSFVLFLENPSAERSQRSVWSVGARMTEMLDFGWAERPYWDRKNWSSLESYKEALKISSTLYVGNLSFYTQESQIYALFDQVRPSPSTISRPSGASTPLRTVSCSSAVSATLDMVT